MVLTVLFGELLVLLIVVAMLQIFHPKWLHNCLYGVLLVSFICVGYYVFSPTTLQLTGHFPFVEPIETVQADRNDRKPRVTISEFSENEADYDYVTSKELHENNQFYEGKLISQWGKVKKVIANDTVGRQLLVDLDEPNGSSTVLINYHLSDLAKGITNVKPNDQIKVYGEGSDKESSQNLPVINAQFIKYE